MIDLHLGRLWAGTEESLHALLNVRWQELYEYGDQLDTRFQEGDTVFAVPADTEVTMEASLLFLGTRYGIQSIKNISGALVLHARSL